MKKVISIIILIIGSFLLFSCFLNLSESKYIGGTDDYLIQVVDKAPKIYDFTGSEQTYTAPLSGYYYVSAWGGNGGAGGNGAIQPGSHSTSTNGSDGSRASNSGGVGGTTNSSNGNGLAGGDGGIPALVRIGAGGGAGGGGRRI